VPALGRLLQFLPAFVSIWMAFGAGMIFSPGVGRRDPRGLGIALSIWGSLLATRFAITPPLWVAAAGAAGLAAAFALFNWAAGSIRGRTFSYAGNHDIPQFVHSSGPYRYVRNPFYASYLLAELATVVMRPSVWGALIVVLAAGYFQWLARFEEAKFARSPVAKEYAQYKARTGRLFPRLAR
jgi:protein-S-isoprenylcysteine O-methyltransferase Ste14